MGNFRTLVFEDNDTVQGLLEALLKRRNHEVITVDPHKYHPLLREHKCRCPEGCRCADFLVTDIYMPGINGLDWIKSQLAEGCKLASVAVLSGCCTRAERDEATAFGCAVFDKPFDIHTFDQWLAQEEQKMDRQAAHAEWFRNQPAAPASDTGQAWPTIPPVTP